MKDESLNSVTTTTTTTLNNDDGVKCTNDNNFSNNLKTTYNKDETNHHHNNTSSTSTSSKKIESIEEYERRFLNSLKNLDTPWLSSANLTLNYKKSNTSLSQTPTIVLTKANTNINSSNSTYTSNTKFKYDRIKQRSKQNSNNNNNNTSDMNTSKQYTTSSSSHSLGNSNPNGTRIRYRNYSCDSSRNGGDRSSINTYDQETETSLKNGESSKSLYGLNNKSNYLSTKSLHTVKRSLSNYSGSSFNLKPLSLSNNSLNSNWYKPKPLQMPLDCKTETNGSNHVDHDDDDDENKNLKQTNKNVQDDLINNNTKKEKQEYKDKDDKEKNLNEISIRINSYPKLTITTAAAGMETSNEIMKSTESVSSIGSTPSTTILLNPTSTTNQQQLQTQKSDTPESMTISLDTSFVSRSDSFQNRIAAGNTREKYLISRLDYRNDDFTNLSDMDDPTSSSNKSVYQNNTNNNNQEAPVVEESYDNLNNSSIIVDEEDINNVVPTHDTTNKSSAFITVPPPPIFGPSYSLVPPPTRNSKTRREFYEQTNQPLPDYINKSNSQSFVISKNDLASSSFNTKSEEHQLSEEIEDYEDENDNELRNYDDDYHQNDPAGSNEDEFFLISTPSPFSLAAKSGARYNSNDDPESFQLIEQDDEYSRLRYPTQYEQNRLSNIIEEEDNAVDEDEKSRKDFSSEVFIKTDTDEQTSKSIDTETVQNYKEMLKLGEEVTNLYKNIENELSKPSMISPDESQSSNSNSSHSPNDASYKPVMKKRVYNLNRSYLGSTSDESNPEKSLISYSQTTSRPPHFDDLKNEEEEPDSILNYLIGRLSEQHKTKLEPIISATPVSKSKLSAEFDEFEKHLLEKYSLPAAATAQPKSDPILQTRLPPADSGYILTRSLYAQHKKINLADEFSSDENDSKKLKSSYDQNLSVQLRNPSSSSISPKSPGGNKIITALSINEIETRKSVRLSEPKADDLVNDLMNKSLDDTNYDEDDSSLSDEKKIKEEIVLIGEKSDIDSLLDNQNNQLYNLIVANSNRASRLSEIESDLNKKRLSTIKNENLLNESNSSRGDDFEIEIEVKKKTTTKLPTNEDENKTNTEVYENELKEVAKYLVSEITKISLNKVRIDDLNERLNRKYFDQDLVSKNDRLLSNLIEHENALVNTAHDVKNLDSIKSRDELFNYYENLEKNLQQVRSEIDKLKLEAVEDLAYLSSILTDQDLVDYDQVYLKPDEDEFEQDEKLDFNKTQSDDDDEDETQYLSQPGSAATTINYANDSSQAYLTPAESWQTLMNITKENLNNVNNEMGLLNVDNDRTIQNSNHLQIPIHFDGNQTDLDEEDNLEKDEDDEEDRTIKNELVINLPTAVETVKEIKIEHQVSEIIEEKIVEPIEETPKIEDLKESIKENYVEEFDVNTIETQQITQIVKSILTRPNVPAPPVPFMRSNTEDKENDKPRQQQQQQPNEYIGLLKSQTESSGLSSKLIQDDIKIEPTTLNINSTTTRSRSTGPTSKRQPLSNSGVVVDKKSLDKFLKLASNSASLLDLNQIPSNVTNSNTKLKTSSQNLLSLCGGPEPTANQQNQQTKSSQNLSKNEKYMTISTTTNANQTRPIIVQTASQKQVPAHKPRARNFDNQIESFINNYSSQQHVNESPLDLNNPKSLVGTLSSNVSSTFRIPSSRHFCGRLLSTNNSTSTSSASESSSYTQQNQKRYVSSEEEISIETEADEEEEEEEIDEDEDEEEDEINNRNNAMSTSSPSTSSSSPNSTSPPYRLNTTYTTSTHQQQQQQQRPQINQRRSVSNTNKQDTDDNKFSMSSENILERNLTNSRPQFKQQEHGSKKEPENLRQQQVLAKSVDHLTEKDDFDEKKHLLVKKIDLQSQKNLSNILESNSKQMGLSKSIKDLRLYVSNSFSPSQIVRPPNPTQTNQYNTPVPVERTTRKDNQLINNSRVLDEMNPNLNYKKPIIMSQTSVVVTQTHGQAPNYNKHMLKPMKNERSDQVRLEFLQQQQMIARLEKQQLKEYLQQKNLNQIQYTRQSITSTSTTTTSSTPNHMKQMPLGNRDRPINDNNDDSLINCILEMKPMPSRTTTSNINQQQPQPQPRSITTHSQPQQQQQQQQQPKIRPDQNQYTIVNNTTNKKDALLINNHNSNNLNNNNLRPLSSSTNNNNINKTYSSLNANHQPSSSIINSTTTHTPTTATASTPKPPVSSTFSTLPTTTTSTKTINTTLQVPASSRTPLINQNNNNNNNYLPLSSTSSISSYTNLTADNNRKRIKKETNL